VTQNIEQVSKSGAPPPPPVGANGLRERGDVCMRDVFILNEIWAEDKLIF
jgi:hypothetical protein